MKIGVVFPQTEIEADAGVVRAYAEAVEGLGYEHILAYDHVLGANPERPGGWRGPYTYQHPFHEVFVLFSYMAAVTTRVEFTTGILILPQRETALVAKQAASLDVLSNGRLRLGVGIGWNKVEYVGLGQDFHTRGKRVEEQVALLRKLWAEPLVTFNGRWHDIPDAGLNPLPVRRAIPIWFGGYADVVLRRVAAMGDGWMPGHREAQDAAADLAKLDRYLAENNRSRSDIGLEPRLHWFAGDIDLLMKQMEAWKKAGATHISLNTMAADFTSADQHLAALAAFAQAAIE